MLKHEQATIRALFIRIRNTHTQMKTNRYILMAVMVTAILASACTQNIVTPEFDYNLKSAQVIETNNEFGLELLKTVFDAEEEANVMISPASVSIALGMAYNGAEGTTRDAFEEVLNYEGLAVRK